MRDHFKAGDANNDKALESGELTKKPDSKNELIKADDAKGLKLTDLNGDGKVQYNEDVIATMLGNEFTKYDTKKDGKLTKEELNKHYPYW